MGDAGAKVPGLEGPLPTQRRSAIQFKYTEDSSLSMRNLGTMLPAVRDDTIESTTYRAMRNLPTDSWEIENCVGYAVQKILRPRWAEIKQLGRSLTIFKVHKDPMVCELFFMPLDEVIKTYTGRFPKNVEWVHLYNPEVEIAFWAELYKPRGGTGGRRSLLTDELCGGAGSRFTICDQANKDEIVRTTLEHSLDTREQTEARLAEAQAKLEKNRKKKERQRAKKAEQKAEVEAEEKRQRETAEAEEMAAIRSAKARARPPNTLARAIERSVDPMPAPMLQGVDFASMMKPKGGGAEPSARAAPARTTVAVDATSVAPEDIS